MGGRENKVPFRHHTPVRSNVTKRAKYRFYKEELRLDFKERCGYCDDSDEFFGGIEGYHIDHFAPKSKFPQLETEYSNLVYSCRFCNGAKSSNWVGDDSSISHNGSEGFIDPCDEAYEYHLDRDAAGRILGRSKLGRYMVKELQLNLLRHQFIWQTQKLAEERAILNSLIAKLDSESEERLAPLLKEFHDITCKLEWYRRRAIESRRTSI